MKGCWLMSNKSLALRWAFAVAGLAVASVGCKWATIKPPTGMDAAMPTEEDVGHHPDVPEDRPVLDDRPVFEASPPVDVMAEVPLLSLDAACVGNSQTAKQVPLDMYIMFYQSTSMSGRLRRPTTHRRL